MRDIVGGISLALGCAAAVALVVGLLRPGVFARRRGPEAEAGGPRPRTLAVALGPIAAGFLLLGWVLLIAPAYDVHIAPQGQIVAAPGTVLAAEVRNEGLLGGTYQADVSLDGAALDEVSLDAPAGEAVTAELAMPDDLAPGEHTLEVGGVAYEFKALTPPDYRIGKLKVDPGVAKVKQTVDASVMVRNVGEADGVFPGVLKVNGKQAATSDVEIDGDGGIALVEFAFERPKPGVCKLDVSGSRATVVVVKPVRLATGTVLANAISGGVGKLVLDNRYRQDCMVSLTKSKSSREPLLSVYVRGRDKATVSGLRDGDYYAFFSVGEDWNRYTDDFLVSLTRARFTKPIPFTTKKWTSSYTDYAAWTIFTTYHTQYTYFTLVLGSSKGTDPGVLVSEKSFPAPR